MRKLLMNLAAIACVSLGYVDAQAATISYSSSVPLQTTNFNQSVSLTLFDPSLGMLNSITLELTGIVSGDIRIESLDAQPSTVTSLLSALLKVLRPDLTTLISVTPSVGFSDNLTAFDGSIDFGGTSGISHLGVSSSTSNLVITPPPVSDLALFTGVGSILLPVTAQASSSASGSGNLITAFFTQAGAEVKVTYDYSTNTPVPEPSTLVIWTLVSGVFVAGRLRNRAAQMKSQAE